GGPRWAMAAGAAPRWSARSAPPIRRRSRRRLDPIGAAGRRTSGRAGGCGARAGKPRRRARSSLFQVFLEKIHGARPGRLGARAVEAPALVAVEAVLRVGVDVDLAVAAALLLDYLDVAHRDRGILVAEMHLRRHLRLLVGILGNLP